MKKTRFMVLLGVMAVMGTTVAKGQSKKEKIAALTFQVDSLQDALRAKNESVIRLQIKLAKIEGETDAKDQEVKRLETRDDSLKDALMTRKATIDSQAAKIAQLTSDNATLQAQQKELTSKNDDLNTQLADLKPKPAPATVTAKNAVSTEAVKEEPKAGNAVPPSKPDLSKNPPNQ
jgi:chromosome segregation ATPase